MNQEATLAAAEESLAGDRARSAWGPVYAAQLVVLAGVYVAAGKLGIELRVAHGVITPVWAPTGLAIAALFLFGFRLWPAVVIGALLTNATSGVSVGTAAGIAVGNTLEAIAGLVLLRAAGVDGSLERARDVLALVVASLVATTVSATIGTLTLLAAGNSTAHTYGSDWLLWWFGDVIGALLVTPLFLVWLRGRQFDRRPARLLEAAALVALLGLVDWIVFFGGRWQYPYVLFPLLLWAALRFGQRGAVTAVFIVAALGIWGTLNGSVAIESAGTTQTVQILQALIAVVAVAVMITAAAIEERARAETEARDSVSLLEAAEEVQAKFLSMATHEMSTPLAVASGYAHLLLENWDEVPDAERQQAVGRIAEQTRRLSQLVEDLLATSRIDSDQLLVRSRVLHLNQLVANVLEDFDDRSVAVDAPTPLLVVADRDHVEQMLVNYLTNAFKYGAPPYRVSLSRRDGVAEVRVRDAGAGVPADFLPRLFERFARGEAAVEQGVGGTGLGLSIVRELARAQGGDAWYEQSNPAGATFCLSLPLAAAT
jgi:signal transduction histidine kinase